MCSLPVLVVALGGAVPSEAVAHCPRRSAGSGSLLCALVMVSAADGHAVTNNQTCFHHKS